ncbi:MAG: thioredoxin family protein [Chitinophagales bacterium]
MPAVETINIPLGYQAPNFNLLDTITNSFKTLDAVKGEKATVVMFICNHCPYVKHINEQLVQLANDYIPKGVAFVAISSNDVENYPDDAPDKMTQVAKEQNYPFPYLYDETQDVAKAYQAACTPDFSIFNKDMRCVYRGQLDNSRPKSDIPVTGNDIRKALDNILQELPLNEKQIPSLGCSIKWKSENN